MKSYNLSIMNQYKFKLSFLILLLVNSALLAQTSNAIIFTEYEEKFTIILNGVKQNNQPESNVKIVGLSTEFYKLKVVFSNPGIGERNFNIYINLGSETTYCIKKNNKGEYMIRLVSEIPIAQATVSNPTQMSVNFTNNPASAPETGVITSSTASEKITIQSEQNNEVSALDSGAHKIDNNSKTDSVSSIPDAGNKNTKTSIVHTTTTTTHTSTSHPKPVRAASFVPGYTGSIGCPQPMSAEEFLDLKASIASKTFEDSRLMIAKQALKEQCIVASQVKELTKLFTFEDNRLQFAKYAYEFTYDIGNYDEVNVAFTFENSIQELKEYINSRK